MSGLRRLLSALVLAGAVAACQAPTPPATLSLGAWAPARARVVVALAPVRQLLATARAWRATDVYSHVVTLAPLPPEAPAGGDLDPAPGLPGADPVASAPVASDVVAPATRTVELVQRPGEVREAIFDEVPVGWRYEVRVQAMGNVGGTAPTRCLNTRTPARGWLDLTAPGAGSRRLELAVRLDPVAFSGTLHLPSAGDDAARLPAWTTGLEATLHEAGSPDVVASAAWLPGQRARFERLRGDVAYDLAVTYHSPTGHRTTQVPGLRFDLTEDPEQVLTASVTAPAAPAGTRLAYQAFGSQGGFMAAIDPQGRIWITHQNAGRVSVRNTEFGYALPEIGVGVEPRGIAVDPVSGAVWVANFRSNTVSRIAANGVLTGSFSAGFFPSGIGVDPQQRVWVASALLGTVRVLGPDGVQVPGSPFYSGSQPGALAIDQATGEVWVANMGDDTITRFRSTGEVAGVCGGGFTPGAIAIGADHVAWVVDSGGNRLWRFNADGAVVGDPIPVGAGPSGLAINAATGEVWVGIMNGERVSRLAADGTLLGTYAVGHFPGTLALAPDGHVVVVGGSAACRLAP
ncbi:MAG: NHL repeat-containing protein [Candidatus Sericytochromatia bacterium]|nr:NHL repeat-containing protein [Candidatus Sericytochromatia bacterium]